MTIKSLGQVGTPAEDFDISNKKYVDDASGGPGALEHIRFTDNQVDFGALNEWVNFAMTQVGVVNIPSALSPIPFDMTIVRMGLTIAVAGSDSGIDGNTLFQIWRRSGVSTIDEELGAIALQAFLTNVDLEVNIPLTAEPGDLFAWRIINNDGTANVIRYEMHMHYVETAQLTESQKKYYKDRADKSRFEVVKSHVNDTPAEHEKRFNDTIIVSPAESKHDDDAANAHLERIAKEGRTNEAKGLKDKILKWYDKDNTKQSNKQQRRKSKKKLKKSQRDATSTSKK